MDISLVLKIVGLGILVAVSCQILSKVGKDEQASFVSIAGIIVALLLLVEEIGYLFDTVRGVFGL
jgi:stage III sporulation protein AC